MMARPRRSQREFARVGARRLTAWQLGPGNDGLVAGDVTAFTASGAQVIGEGITPLLPNLTVVRIHGQLSFALNTAAAVREGYDWMAGIGVITADAFAVALGFPQPLADIDWPGWMWHAQGDMRPALGALAIGDPSINPVRVEIETKSMRKLRLNEVLFMAVQVGESGTATMDVRGHTRVLIKLP